MNHEPWHFIDVLPTLAAVAGGRAPAECAGEDLAGRLAGRRVRRGPLFWEHEGSRAVREGKWKLTAVHPEGAWELYDIEADRTETRNLAAAEPERVKRMAEMWARWAKENYAVPWIWKPAFGEAGKQ